LAKPAHTTGKRAITKTQPKEIVNPVVMSIFLHFCLFKQYQNHRHSAPASGA
jgi:hypothetical protein